MGRSALRLALAALPCLAAAMTAGSGHAYANALDLDLLNLCTPHTAPKGTLGALVPECEWVKRQPGTGLIDGVTIDTEAESRFRSLMSELGIVMAPRLMVPAESLGFAGFQVAGEVGMTTISRSQPFWNGVEKVSASNPNSSRPGNWLTTVGGYVRKGIWLPVPAFEVGAGVMHLMDSQLLSWQGYAKLALHEGFHDWPLPSLAVRASGAFVTGSPQTRLTITGIDVVLSKGYGILKTSRLEPFGGWSFLYIRARSGRIDATPSCDAYVVRNAAAGQPLGDYCAEAQRGTDNDSLATFAFPDQDTITRHRFFGGAKLKFGAVFASAQYEIAPVGRSRDERRANGARDGSGKQESLSLSAGFDY